MESDCIVFEGYLNLADDIDRLISDFTFVGRSAAKATFSEDSARQLWFNLTEGGVDRNVYCVTMPYLCIAVPPNSNNRDTCAFIIKDFKSFGIEPDKSTAILFSSTLRMQIKENPEDTVVQRTAIWVPPRDFRLLHDAPAPKCYVEIFLTDLKFVGNYEGVGKNPSIFDYVLGNSKVCRTVWGEFKQTFMGE